MASLVQVARDAAVLRLRSEGRSFQAVAGELGLATREAARQAFRRARVRAVQLPVELDNQLRTNLQFVAWAAGFFDGEGCVYGGEGLQKGGYRRFTFSVTVSQTRPEPLEALRRAWGGAIHTSAPRNPRHQPQWHWGIRGAAAGRFLSDILPYLRVKEDVARAAIPCLANVHKHGMRFTEAELLGRRAAIAVIQTANRRGEVSS